MEEEGEGVWERGGIERKTHVPCTDEIRYGYSNTEWLPITSRFSGEILPLPSQFR